jgi:hypothetical protein
MGCRAKDAGSTAHCCAGSRATAAFLRGSQVFRPVMVSRLARDAAIERACGDTDGTSSTGKLEA